MQSQVPHENEDAEEVNEIEFLCDDGEPLQLVKFDRNTGQFTLEPEAVKMLSAVSGNVGFCSLAGKYRTGKSFLLNQLLCLKGPGVRLFNLVQSQPHSQCLHRRDMDMEQARLQH